MPNLKPATYIFSFKFFIILFVIIGIISCQESPEKSATSSSDVYKTGDLLETPEVIHQEKHEEIPEPILKKEYSAPGTLEKSAIKPKKLKIALQSEKDTIDLGESVQITVWIGPENTSPKFNNFSQSDSTIISAEIGQYAKIIPYAPDFEILEKEFLCIELKKTDSYVRFTIRPKSVGIFKVSTNIQIYENALCEGASVSRLGADLQIMVKVNRQNEIDRKLSEMGDVVWDKFMIFWTALIAFLFGSLLYFIKKKFRKNENQETNN